MEIVATVASYFITLSLCFYIKDSKLIFENIPPWRGQVQLENHKKKG